MLRSTLIVIVFFALSKLTGFIKLLLITRTFGVGSEADALTAALQLPELFVAMVSGGALTAALIPIYSRYKGSETGEQLARSAVALVMLLLGLICGLAALFAEPLAVHLLVPGFAPELQATTAALMRLLLLSMLIVGVSACCSGLLNAHHHFALPALATVVIDIGYIIGLIWLSSQIGIFGAAWGAVIGACLHLLVQIPALLRHRINVLPALHWRLPALRELMLLMAPRVAALCLIETADLVVIRAGSRLPAGSVSAYYFALLVVLLPTSLFGWAVALVIFPSLAESYNSGDIYRMRRLGSYAITSLWSVLVPAAVGLVALGRPGMAVIFERGQFEADDTLLLTSLVSILALRIVLEPPMMVLERFFFARHNTRTVLWAQCGWFVAIVVLVVLLADRFGARGLALAHVAALAILFALLHGLNRRRYADLTFRPLLRRLSRIALASGGMLLCILPLHMLPLSPLQFVVVAVTTGCLSYLAFFLLLHRDGNSWRLPAAGQVTG